jgi:hypothetical protein
VKGAEQVQITANAKKRDTTEELPCKDNFEHKKTR